MIKLINVTKKYKNKVILDSFNYEFNDYGIYYLVGPSGSGKTTLLNIISGIIEPSDGKVIYDNIDSIYKDCYYSYQDFNLFSKLSVIDNIKLLFKIKDKKYDEQVVLDILNSLNILDLKDRKANEISGGERQRLTLAIALALKSKVLILDEPTANLDKDNAINIINLLKEYAKNLLVIVSTHDLSYIDNTDNIINLKEIEFKKVDEEPFRLNKQKKINLGLKSLIVKNKTMSKQYIRFIMQALIISFFITFATFLIPLSKLTKESLNSKNAYNSGYVIASTEKKFNQDFNENYLTGYLSASNLNFKVDLYDTVKPDIISDGFLIDNSLKDHELLMTSSVCDALYQFDLLDNTKDYEGQTFNANGYQFVIKKVYNSVKSKYHEQNDYSFIVCNETSEYVLSRGLKTIIYCFNDTYKIEGINSIEKGHVKLSNEFMIKNNLSLNIGDNVKLTFNVDELKLFMGFNMPLDMDFIYDGLSEDFDINVSPDDLAHIDNVLDDYLESERSKNSDVTYQKTIVYRDFTSQKQAYQVLKYLNDNNIKYYNCNYYNNYVYTDVYQSMAKMCMILIPVSIFIVIITSFYMSHNTLKENERNFDTLRLLGVSKKATFEICAIEQIESVLIAIIFSIAPVIFANNWYVNTGKDIEYLLTEKINYNFFQFKYYALSIFVALALISLFTLIQLLFKNNKKTFIN